MSSVRRRLSGILRLSFVLRPSLVVILILALFIGRARCRNLSNPDDSDPDLAEQDYILQNSYPETGKQSSELVNTGVRRIRVRSSELEINKSQVVKLVREISPDLVKAVDNRTFLDLLNIMRSKNRTSLSGTRDVWERGSDDKEEVYVRVDEDDVVIETHRRRTKKLCRHGDISRQRYLEAEERFTNMEDLLAYLCYNNNNNNNNSHVLSAPQIAIDKNMTFHTERNMTFHTERNLKRNRSRSSDEISSRTIAVVNSRNTFHKLDVLSRDDYGDDLSSSGIQTKSKSRAHRVRIDLDNAVDCSGNSTKCKLTTSRPRFKRHDLQQNSSYNITTDIIYYRQTFNTKKKKVPTATLR